MDEIALFTLLIDAKSSDEYRLRELMLPIMLA